MRISNCALPVVLMLGVTFLDRTFSAEPDVAKLDIALEKALQSEAQGVPVNRKQSLETSSDIPPVRWHSGDILRDGQWISFADLGTASDESIDKYQAKRSEFQRHPDYHRIMARWCALNDLPQLAKAHYYGVLSASPNDVDAHAAIGDQRVLNRWYSSDELATAKTKSLRLLEQLDTWVPKIGKLAAKLRESRSTEKLASIEAFERIQREDAIPALEFFALNAAGDAKQLLIKTISRLRSSEACLSLARIALRDSESEAGQAAIRELRTYPDEMYVPELLQLLSSARIESELVAAPNGKMALVTLVTQELKDAKYTQRLQKFVSLLASVQTSASIGTSGKSVEYTKDTTFASFDHNVSKMNLGEMLLSSPLQHETLASVSKSATYVPRAVATAAARNLLEDRAATNTSAAEYSRLQNENNHRVCTVLRAVTDATMGDSPEQWWRWWIDTNERYVTEKPTYQAYSTQHQRIAINSKYGGSSIGSFDAFAETPYKYMQWSCLVSGTLVQTLQGLLPIEKIQIGDLVMSQDVESGELALKPVIQTTVRPPKSTLKITLDSGEIQATGGHLWWVSGRGWLKTRDLKPGMLLHNASGTSEVRGLDEDARQRETYNLVVDGYHTYFVGEDRVLSYDNTIVKPTLRTVPGYGLLASVVPAQK